MTHVSGRISLHALCNYQMGMLDASDVSQIGPLASFSFRPLSRMTTPV
jgi:hypothetical protein